MERIEDGDGNVVAAYYYDPFGRRLWKEVGGVRTYFVYADEGLVGEFDATGQELRAYGYTPGSMWSSAPVFQRSAGNYYWYRNDQSGTPQKITTTSGAVVWSGIYDAFGNVQIAAQEGFISNLRLAGQYFDDESGLYYNFNRYYDPALGRYLRADPFGEGLNLYAYVFNNPLALVDPKGHCAVHGALALAGMVPLFGTIPDLIDAGLYLLEGNAVDAALSGAAAIPLAGLFSRGGQIAYKIGKWGAKYAPGAVDLARKARNAGKKLTKEIMERIGRGAPKSVGYHATHPEAAEAILEGGFRQGTKPGRLGSHGTYVNSTPEGAIAEFQFHNPGVKPKVLEVQYKPGVNANTAVPPRNYVQEHPLNVDSITAPSVRAPNTTNTNILNGSAKPVRVIP